MKCSLVDDERRIREGLTMLLWRRGFEVHTVIDCAAAQHGLASLSINATPRAAAISC
jgi:DNA-binding response OmpR family regulator